MATLRKPTKPRTEPRVNVSCRAVERIVSGVYRNTVRSLLSGGIGGITSSIRCDSGMAHPPGSTSEWEAGAMRTMSRTGLVSAGLGLGVVGGFVGGLLRERNALTAARDAAGEGSEEQPSWAVGSYRSRWTTFRTFPSVVARASSGSWTQSAARQR
ncbi:hypothetical protein GCM10010121_027250 [Streptomyces brasiliensis]|uniref:Uncharacterized protein n=1 Tax=Streptomyces brasiliensis TaxID=1954 RepID=A0A917NP25_9ACTN|nr:hypothetical protein GCM10010121_027250 [Streptomyces brasiliensis]